MITTRAETTNRPLPRRHALSVLAGAALAVCAPPLAAQGTSPAKRWYDAAVAMRKKAEASGDQPFGAVVVADNKLVGEGPSRVMLDVDNEAHAERVAIRDAQKKLGKDFLTGAVLYSTSRPCRKCEQAAAKAGIARMIYGEDLRDGGKPEA